ncbi:MAG: hypothetical protein KUG80_05795 [Gammaproteobacteria bacterium]|nr:hypothetical protein [Gammaproteobacteria bacterium]
MNTPIELQLDGIKVATILSFGYETPWATGKVEFLDDSLFNKVVAVTSMSSFDLEMDELGLEDDEEEKMWEAKLIELGISWQDLKLDRDGRWSVTPSGSESQSIYSPRFYESKFMDWRL